MSHNPPVFDPSQIVNNLRISWGGSDSNTTRSWSGGNITYSMPDVASASPESPGQWTMTGHMKNVAQFAFEFWDDLMAYNLNPIVNSNAQIDFHYSTLTKTANPNDGDAVVTNGPTYAHPHVSGDSPYYTLTAEEIWFSQGDGRFNTDPDIQFDTFGFQTYLHEIGHSLGLSHAGSYNFSANYHNDAEFQQDTVRYTIMSYFDADEDGSGTQHFGQSSQTPMLYDVATIQAMYGADPTTRTGNTTYGFNASPDTFLNKTFTNTGRDGTVTETINPYDFRSTSNPNPIVTIYDAGGNDTLDVSQFGNVTQLIDLRAGEWSNIGGMTNNLAIAFNVADILAVPGIATVIENAKGSAGADTIRGNAANNQLYGNDGDDTLLGDAGIDFLWGGRNNDTLDGGATLLDWAMFDEFTSDVAVDLVNGTALGIDSGADTLIGIENAETGSGHDILYGNTFNNVLDGNGGDDRFYSSEGFDTLIGDDGFDTVDYSALSRRIDVDLSITAGYQTAIARDNLGFINKRDDLYSIERVFGTAFDDTLVGSDAANTLDGGGGADTMSGGRGDDTYIVDDPLDQVIENPTSFGFGFLFYGNDTVRTTLASHTLAANVENLVGTSPTGQTLTGNGLDNTLYGGTGHDTLDGGVGADTMIGGTGNDTYVIDSLGDVVTENANEGTDTVNASINYALGSNVENLTLTGSGNINATGNALANTLTGNAGNNTLNGGTGVDSAVFSGLRSSYTLTDLGNGSVRVVGPDGTDTLTSVERLAFDDQTITWPPPTTLAAGVAQGDFNSDSKLDFVWRDGNGQTSMWSANSSGDLSTTDLGAIGLTWNVLADDHFSNSSTAQMLAQGATDGNMSLWWVSGGQLAGVSMGQAWNGIGYIATGQFTNHGGAGIANFLVNNLTDHHLYDWWIDSNNILQGIDLGAAWNNIGYIATGQFTANGGTNFLVANTADNHLYDWWIDTNTNTLQGIDLGAAWNNMSFAASGQFTSNGGTNMLVRNNADNHMYVWWVDTNSHTLQGVDLGARWAGHQLLASGNFNGDGNTEMLIRNTADNHVYKWWVTAQGHLDGADLGVVSPNWQVAQTSDYNSDGYTDILWRNVSDGKVAVGFNGAPVSDLPPQASAPTGSASLANGPGNDLLVGAAGDDTFVFKFGDGVDRVANFVAGDSSGDLIELHGYGIASFAELQPHMNQSSADVVINFDASNQITLQNVMLGQLNQHDFLLNA